MKRLSTKARILIEALVGAVLAAVFSTACSTSGCTDNRNAIPLAGFYDAESESQISVSGLEIGGVGAPRDTLIADSAETNSQIYLPLRSQTAQTSFYIRYKQNPPVPKEYYDTLTFVYRSEPWFTSAECGATYRYHITLMEYTRHIVDSVAIIDSLITNIDRETLKIFFRTSSEEEEQPADEGLE